MVMLSESLCGQRWYRDIPGINLAVETEIRKDCGILDTEGDLKSQFSLTPCISR